MCSAQTNLSHAYLSSICWGCHSPWPLEVNPGTCHGGWWACGAGCRRRALPAPWSLVGWSDPQVPAQCLSPHPGHEDKAQILMRWILISDFLVTLVLRLDNLDNRKCLLMGRDNQIKGTVKNATPTSSLVSLFSLSRGSCLMWVAMAKAARSWLSARLMTLVIEGSMEPWQLVPMMVPFSHTASSSCGTQSRGLGH